MKINLNFNKHIKLLLKLYNVKEGTLASISKQIQEPVQNGCLYNIKNDLIKLNILIPKESIIARKGRGEGELINYRINHEAIDQIFFGDLPTDILFERAKKLISGIYIKGWKKRNINKLLSKIE